ncbi:hypothetical protein P154DRAFT_263936 [Amniculicola lignicola CBS 123094]|uniref:Uncharacterized protein n=1 Tax=Amniculicola lignicola CBS 123094 TaxID=1392246 RepID=A0A6A5W8D7_9PLEO|nr:hypothetical protein P154DRAFT_263936 [Amniculicola lignicola CBS 123094]
MRSVSPALPRLRVPCSVASCVIESARRCLYILYPYAFVYLRSALSEDSYTAYLLTISYPSPHGQSFIVQYTPTIHSPTVLSSKNWYRSLH